MLDMSPVMEAAVARILRAQRPDLPEEIDALMVIVRHYAAQLDAIEAQVKRVHEILERNVYGPEHRPAEQRQLTGPETGQAGRSDRPATPEGV